MPIIQRTELIKEIRWTHRMHNQYFDARFQCKRERVVNAEPVIHWAMGRRYDAVRELCSMQGWELEDLREKTK